MVSRCARNAQGCKHTSFKGRVMGLPLGSPTGAWIWAAARPAKKVMMVALEYMLMVVVVVLGD